MNIIKGHTYAANLDLTSNERLIFLYLVDLSNENNICFPSLNTIANHVNVSKRTVQRGIDKLCSDGIIIKRPFFWTNGRQSSNIYEVISDPTNLEMREAARKENERIKKEMEKKNSRIRRLESPQSSSEMFEKEKEEKLISEVAEDLQVEEIKEETIEELEDEIEKIVEEIEREGEEGNKELEAKLFNKLIEKYKKESKEEQEKEGYQEEGWKAIRKPHLKKTQFSFDETYNYGYSFNIPLLEKMMKEAETKKKAKEKKKRKNAKKAKKRNRR